MRKNEAPTSGDVNVEEPMEPYKEEMPPPPAPSSGPVVIPQKPDGIMLHPTELHITPQRPLVPPKPKRPSGTPPEPLPQYQEGKHSSSPH